MAVETWEAFYCSSCTLAACLSFAAWYTGVMQGFQSFLGVERSGSHMLTLQRGVVLSGQMGGSVNGVYSRPCCRTGTTELERQEGWRMTIPCPSPALLTPESCKSRSFAV